MNEQATGTNAETGPGVSGAAAPVGRGWYLFGITRSPDPVDALAETLTLIGDGTEIILLGDLAAVVRPVPLAEFGAERLTEHLGDPVWLEAQVRGHHDVLSAVQERQVILPAKFGLVFGSAADLGRSIEGARPDLVVQLDRFAGCDEWEVRVQLDLTEAGRRIAETDPAVAEVANRLAESGPGSGYLRRQQFAQAVARATRGIADDLAAATHACLAGRSVAAARNAVEAGSSGARPPEILRASYLVRRADRDAFFADLHQFVESQPGLSAAYSGPWPPYAFAETSEPAGGERS